MQTYLTTEQLASRIHYDVRAIRNRLKDTVLLEGVHYIRPFGGRKILFIWEHVERQLGHVNTTMLFKTYSRFIPNLTRTDGSAFNSLVSSVIDHPNAPPVSTVDAPARASMEMHP